MSTNINQNLVKQFILQKVGSSMTANEAKKLGLDNEFNSAADAVEKDELNLNDIVLAQDLYEEFATMLVDEKDAAKVADEENDKEEQAKVKDKNGAGV